VLPPPGLPFPVLEPVINEQTAHFIGWFWETTNGMLELSHFFEGDGFKEFTTLHPVPGSGR
jgi:hypothetical protein